MANEPRKRTATEPASTLFTIESEPPTQGRRPPALIGGVLLVVGRAAGSAAWAISLFASRHTIQTEFDLEAGITNALVGILVSIAAVWMLFLLLLAWLIWRGSNAARMLVLFGATLSISVAAVSYFAAGGEITVDTTLLTLALDILILLALSSRDARSWSRVRRSAIPRSPASE